MIIIYYKFYYLHLDDTVLFLKKKKARVFCKKSSEKISHLSSHCVGDLVSCEYKSGREIAHLQPAIEIFWSNIYLQIIYDGNAEREKRIELKGMHVHWTSGRGREKWRQPLY